MKVASFIAFLISSLSCFACPDLTGVYTKCETWGSYEETILSISQNGIQFNIDEKLIEDGSETNSVIIADNLPRYTTADLYGNEAVVETTNTCTDQELIQKETLSIGSGDELYAVFRTKRMLKKNKDLYIIHSSHNNRSQDQILLQTICKTK